eukprot:scaffold5364_cov164-Amphora_coffeaeformis.AAC.16
MTLQSIGKAFGLAALYWSVIYVVVVHLFVLWKWESYSVSPRSRAALMNQTKQAETKQETRTVMVDQTAEWTQTQATTRSAIESTQADIHRMEAKQAQLQGIMERMNRALDNLVVKEKALQELENILPSLLPPTKEEEFIIFHDGNVSSVEYMAPFRDLASISDLGDIGNTKDLQKAFSSVSEAMDTYLEEAGESTQWASINQLFRDASYPDKASKVSACPVIPDNDVKEEDSPAKEENSESADEEANKDTPAATEEDVAARQNEIRAVWEALYEDRVLPVSDGEIKRLEKVRQGLVDKWMQRVQESLDDALDKVELAIAEAQRDAVDDEGLVTEVVGEDEEGTNAKCAKTDDVLAVIEAGIDAVHRKQNLQEALRQAMSDRDRGLGDVILDADLPLGESRPQAMGPSTLRQYLDSALLTHDVPQLIHAIVDLAGGYHDELDKLIDSLPENVGEVAVQHVLDTAGSVNLSKIQEQLNVYLAAAEKRIADMTS